MSTLDSIATIISDLTVDLFGFLLSSTQVLFLFLLCWAVKEALIKMAPTLFRQLIRFLLLPGDLLHSLAHVVATRLLGYKVNVRIGIATGEVERSLLIASGDDIRTRHAIFIALAPLILHSLILAILGLSAPFFNAIQSVDLYFLQLPGKLLFVYFLVCIIFYALPDLGDWMFIYHTMIDRYPYAVYGYIWAGFCWILGVTWIGYIPATLLFSIYVLLVYYTCGRETLEAKGDPVKTLLEALELDPDLVNVLPYDT